MQGTLLPTDPPHFAFVNLLYTDSSDSPVVVRPVVVGAVKRSNKICTEVALTDKLES